MKTDPKAPARACYCHSMTPESRQERNIPEGYCGICERCGQLGHTQHFPGPVPYTGAWCDRCVKIVALTWPLKHPVVWIALVLVAAVLFGLLRR